jgi:hypothetical protein
MISSSSITSRCLLTLPSQTVFFDAGLPGHWLRSSVVRIDRAPASTGSASVAVMSTQNRRSGTGVT